MTLKTDIDRIATDSGLLHSIIHGTAGQTVATDGGSVPTVAKAIADLVTFFQALGVTLSQNPAAVAISGGAINDTVIGHLARAAAYFTTLAASGNVSSDGQFALTPLGTTPRYLLVDQGATYVGSLVVQAGNGSSGNGGAINLFGHSHATRPGQIVAGISVGSGGKFAVNNQATAGGTDVFSVDAMGDVSVAGNITLTPSGSETRWILVNAGAELSGRVVIQAGNGSPGNGGAINLFGHSHATRPGQIVAGISVGSGGKFVVNNQALAGGTDVFSVSATGNVLGAGVYTNTTANASNVYVDSTGLLYRSTSTQELKTAVEPMSVDAARVVVSGFKALYYRSLCANDNPAWSWYGAFAEELAAVDPRFCHFGYRPEDLEDVEIDDGEVDEPVTDVVSRPEPTIELRDGVPVLVINHVDATVPRVNMVPVVDEAGVPVLIDEQPLLGADGNAVTARVPLLHPVPVTQRVRKSHVERRPKLGATMVPVGIAYERLTAPIMVVLQDLLSRLSSIEDRIGGGIHV